MKKCQTNKIVLLDEIWIEIILFLDICEIVNVMVINKRFYNLANSEYFWKKKSIDNGFFYEKIKFKTIIITIEGDTWKEKFRSFLWWLNEIVMPKVIKTIMFRFVVIIDTRFFSNRFFVLKCLKQKSTQYEFVDYLSDSQKKNTEILMLLLRNNLININGLDKKFLNNKLLMLEAIKYNWKAINCIGKKLKYNLDFFIKAIEINRSVITVVDDTMREIYYFKLNKTYDF